MYRRKGTPVEGPATVISAAVTGISVAVAGSVLVMAAAVALGADFIPAKLMESGQGMANVVLAEAAETNLGADGNPGLDQRVEQSMAPESNIVLKVDDAPEDDGIAAAVGPEDDGIAAAVSPEDDMIVASIASEDEVILVAIEPGYGGTDKGDSGSISIALQVHKLLEEKGYQVLLNREEDADLSSEEWVQLAEGIKTWCQKEDSRRLSGLIPKYAADSIGAGDTKEVGDLSEEYQLELARGIVKGIDLFFHPRTMYLTFDDGPSAENTNAVLDILAEKNIKATFFVVGKNVEKHPEVARRIVQEGHTIGIHSNTHDYNVIYESVESYLEDFEAACSIVKEVTGVEPVLFRFPGGSINSYNEKVYKDIIQEMTDRGYIYFDWNASLEDAVKKSTPEQLIENAVESTLGRKRVVMLAHDVVYNTTLCLEELIDRLPEYRMEALTEDVEPIQFRGE